MEDLTLSFALDTKSNFPSSHGLNTFMSQVPVDAAGSVANLSISAASSPCPLSFISLGMSGKSANVMQKRQGESLRSIIS